MFGKKQIIMIIAIVAAALVAVAVVLMTLPKAPSTEPTSEPVSSSVDVLTQTPDNGVTFTSTVYNLIGASPLVSVNGGLCRVSTRVKSDVPVPNMAIGDVIEVVYDGRIALSYPGQINFVYAIRLVDGEHPPMTYVFTPKPSAQKTKTPLVNDIYYYGLDGMDVTVESITMDLKQALQVGLVSPEYLLAQAQRDVSVGKATPVEYKDGGSKLYRYPNYAILKMNTIAGDKTLYIGTTDLTPTAVKETQENDSSASADRNVPKAVTDLVEVQLSDSTEPERKSNASSAWSTKDVIYYVGIQAVNIRTDDKYTELMRCLVSSDFKLSELLSDLTAEAAEEGACVFADGQMTDGSPFTRKRLSFDDFIVYTIGYGDRREVYFCAPNADGDFVSGIQERIAEDMPKYPLTVKKNSDPMPHKITKATWKLDYDVYYTGIDRATVTVGGKTMDLIQAVDSGLLTFDELVADAARLEKNGLIRVETIKDGGSKKYYFDGYSIFKKHTLNGDRSLYIQG